MAGRSNAVPPGDAGKSEAGSSVGVAGGDFTGSIAAGSDTTRSVPGIDATRLVPAPGSGENSANLKVLPDENGGERDRGATLGYDEQIEMLRDEIGKIKIQSEEERRQREQRERRRRLIATIGDGIAAMGNIYFASQGAPSMYSGNGSLNSVQASIDRGKAERDANDQKRIQYKMKLGELIGAREIARRKADADALEAKLMGWKIQREQQLADMEAELAPYKVSRAEHEADKAEHEADKAEHNATSAQAEAENAPKMAEAKLNTEIARAGAQNASIDASRASAENSRASAAAHNRSNVNEFSAWDKQGREHKFRTKDAADRFARQQGTFTETEQTSTSTVNDGRKTRTTTSKKPGGYPSKPQSQNNTMPGVSSGNGNKMPGVK